MRLSPGLVDMSFDISFANRRLQSFCPVCLRLEAWPLAADVTLSIYYQIYRVWYVTNHMHSLCNRLISFASQERRPTAKCQFSNPFESNSEGMRTPIYYGTSILYAALNDPLTQAVMDTVATQPQEQRHLHERPTLATGDWADYCIREEVAGQAKSGGAKETSFPTSPYPSESIGAMPQRHCPHPPPLSYRMPTLI